MASMKKTPLKRRKRAEPASPPESVQKTPLKRRKLDVESASTTVKKTPLKRRSKPAPTENDSPNKAPPECVESRPVPTELVGVDREIIERVREHEMTDRREAEDGTAERRKRELILRRLPRMVEMLRSIYVSERKTTLPLERLVPRLIQSARIATTRAEVMTDLRELASVAPEFISIFDMELDALAAMGLPPPTNIKNPTQYTFVRINKTANIATVQQAISKILSH